jgi:hypothetical protein
MKSAIRTVGQQLTASVFAALIHNLAKFKNPFDDKPCCKTSHHILSSNDSSVGPNWLQAVRRKPSPQRPVSPLRLPVVLSLPTKIRRPECESENLLHSAVQVQNPWRVSYRHTGKTKLCVLVPESHSENDII